LAFFVKAEGLFVVAAVSGVLPSIRDDVVFKVLPPAAVAVVFVGVAEFTFEATAGLLLGVLAGVLAAAVPVAALLTNGLEAATAALAVPLAVRGREDGEGAAAVLAGGVLADGTVERATKEILAAGAAAVLDTEVGVFEGVSLAGLAADGRADNGTLGAAEPAVAVAGLAGVVDLPAAAALGDAAGVVLLGYEVAFAADTGGLGDNKDKGF
jgi:hypothetical protein